jgi:hypothetical protein
MLRDKKQREAGENCVMSSSIICAVHQILLGSEVNKTGETCSTHGRSEKLVQNLNTWVI